MQVFVTVMHFIAPEMAASPGSVVSSLIGFKQSGRGIMVQAFSSCHIHQCRQEVTAVSCGESALVTVDVNGAFGNGKQARRL
jgi:hypothetical protein